MKQSIMNISPDQIYWDGSKLVASAVPDLAGNLAATVDQIGTIAAAVYYVDIATGDDGNDGLSAGAAFKTIQHALDLFSNKVVIGDDAKIRICAGDYSGEGQLSLANCTGDLIIIAFDGSNDVTTVNTTYKIDSIAIVACINVRLLSLNATSTTADATMFSVENSIGSCYYCSSSSSSTGQSGIKLSRTTIYVGFCSFSNKSKAIYALHASVVFSRDHTAGSGNTTGLVVAGSVIMKDGTQPQGATAESEYYGGEIR
jgi:hypothetical protein